MLIKEKMKARVSSWKECQLSQAGKAILVQSVLQVILLYFMGCFLLPKNFLHELNMIMARFWWGNTSSKKKIHWRNYDPFCLSKLDEA